MAADGVNIAEDAEMAECDGDKVVTMMDVLQEQQEFEEDANAVLGASDDKNCTYPKGYIKRQALYACLTCCTEAKTDPTKRAGVCLACSLTCHENHELIELYTKRNFRCDCGNPKFNSHPCQFTPDKSDLNDDNIYNQNFSGLYCICHRPYPDPESPIEDDMIQCIICEDWLHASHLEAVVPANDQYSEMICKGCMEKNEFLHDYTLYAVTAETGEVDIVNGDAKSADNSLCNGDLEKEELVNGVEENRSETATVPVSGDVEMDEDKIINGSEKEKNETNVETKQDDLSKTVSTELKPEENDKPDDVNDNIINSDAENKMAQQEEQSMETSETNEPSKNDAPANTEDSNTEKENEEISKDTKEKSDQNNETQIEKTDSIDDKMESTDTEPQKTNEATMEQTETQKDSKSEESERTEQQLLDDLSALTDDNPTSGEKEDTATEEIPIENKEKSEDSMDTNNEESPQETTNESVAGSEEKPVSETVAASGNVEAPDTSQPENIVSEKAEDKSDSVMDAIDQLLHTANKAKENAEKNIESTSESTESKETTENVETQESNGVEISASENKLDNEVPEKTEETAELNDKPTTNKETTHENGVSSEDKPVSETVSDNVEIADTSQPEKIGNENDEDKSDSVMDAIDQLLQTANEAKDNETAKENIESTSESTESKENTENVETQESNDVEMSASENKLDNEVLEKTDETGNDKLTTSTDTDVEMSAENESAASESKLGDATIDADSKDVNDTEASNNSETTVSEDKLDNGSLTDVKEKVTDAANEDISKENEYLNETEIELKTLSETDNELKATNENDSTNKNEPSKDDNEASNVTKNAKEHKRKLSTDSSDDITSKKAKLECVRPKGVKRVHQGATFWPSNFRQKLCTCGECLSMYNDLKVLFLTDLEDTVFAYESLGKENAAGGVSQYEKGLQALSSLDRIQQINALTEYNKMRDKLLDFLKSFKDRKEIVKEEDIKAFFAGMKPRREPDGVYFCR